MSERSQNNLMDIHDKHGRVLARCLLVSLRELRRSVRRNRTLSLPNAIRFFKRRWSDTSVPVRLRKRDRAAESRGAMLLDTFYRCQQPFRGTDWRRARRWLRSVAVAEKETQ